MRRQRGRGGFSPGEKATFAVLAGLALVVGVGELVLRAWLVHTGAAPWWIWLLK